MVRKKKRNIRVLGKILFLAYVAFILYFLLVSDWYGRDGRLEEYTYNLELFKEINRFWTYRESLGFFVVFANLIGNIIIFIPLGFVIPIASKYRSFIAATVYSFVLSLFVEIFQLITRIGSFDVDDLLLNTIGGSIGYIVFIICCCIRRRYVCKKNKKRIRKTK